VVRVKKNDQAVVFVHGIWMNGLQLKVLESRVARYGYLTATFNYRSVVLTPKQNARRLQRYIGKIRAQRIHVVAHSLGGLVLKHLMHSYMDKRIDRVIMVGTPLSGSDVAREFGKNEVTQKVILGNSVNGGLLGGAPAWPEGRPLAMIAGDRGLGLGMLLNKPGSLVGDGTVFLHETHSDEVSHHHVVPESHSGMLFSPEVAKAIVSYLEFGDFEQLTRK